MTILDKRDRQLLVLSFALQNAIGKLAAIYRMPDPNLEHLRRQAIQYGKFEVNCTSKTQIAQLLAQIDAELG